MGPAPGAELTVIDLSPLPAILAAGRVLPELPRLLAPGASLFLVGGALRDLHLGRPVADFDFAGPGDPTRLARAFAEGVGGHWFILDAARRQSRVVIPGEPGQTVDFAPFRARGLEADLRLRDFTVNALAVELHPDGTLGPLLDPLGGAADLADLRLRACSAGVFQDDPLRVLKGVRHAVTLGFLLDEETAGLMRQAGPELLRSAPERLRAEVAAIFAAERFVDGIELLGRLGLLPALFGPARGGEEAPLARMRRLEAAFAALPSDSAPLLGEELEAGLPRIALLRLAAFLRDRGVDDPQGVAVGLRLGRRTTAVLRQLVTLSSALGEEAAALPDLPRARALWAEGLGASPVDALLFSPALTTAGPELLPLLAAVLRDWQRLQRGGRVPDLVDGAWLRQHLGIPEGPAVGAAHATLRRAEIAGRVRSPEEARRFLAEREKSR